MKHLDRQPGTYAGAFEELRALIMEIGHANTDWAATRSWIRKAHSALDFIEIEMARDATAGRMSIKPKKKGGA